MQIKYTPRSLRNCNPLNIRKSSIRWTGALPTDQQTDEHYVQFKSLDYGYRAAWKMLDSIRLRLCSKLPFTMANVIREWIKLGSGKDPDEYIARIMIQTGIKPNELLPLPEQDCYGKLHEFLAAMTCLECGIEDSDVNRESIHAGHLLAFE